MLKRNPGRTTQRTRQVSNRRIGRDDQVEVAHDRGCVYEGIGSAIKFIAQYLYDYV